jgi:hypothetical protein
MSSEELMAMTILELTQFADETLGLRIPKGTTKGAIIQRIVNSAIAARDV